MPRKIILNDLSEKNILCRCLNYCKGFFSPIIIITIIGFIFGFYEYRINNQRQRQAATIDYLKEFSNMVESLDSTLLNTIDIYGYRKNYNIDYKQLRIFLEENPKYRHDLDNILSYLNRFALGCCYNDFFDEDIAWAVDNRMIVNTTIALVPYFQILEIEENRKKDSFVYPFLRSMVYKWRTDSTYVVKFNKKLYKINLDTLAKYYPILFPSSME